MNLNKQTPPKVLLLPSLSTSLSPTFFPPPTQKTVQQSDKHFALNRNFLTLDSKSEQMLIS